MTEMAVHSSAPSTYTGDDEVATPQTLALLRATAVAIESHLALAGLIGVAGDTTAHARLTVLGSGRPRWATTDDDGHPQITNLIGRHADILVLLSRHAEGLTAARARATAEALIDQAITRA
jgi:hypothetical protein